MQVPKNNAKLDSTPRTLLSTNSTPSVTPEALPAATVSPTTDSTENKTEAIVISETAHLRASANKTGSIIEELPGETKVDVIKQSGAWFYVQTSTQKGWLHGNTIRLLSNKQTPKPTLATLENASKPAPSVTRESTAPDVAGASARCRDGSLSYSQSRRGTCSHHGGGR